jgi:hypothetical protein
MSMEPDGLPAPPPFHANAEGKYDPAVVTGAPVFDGRFPEPDGDLVRELDRAQSRHEESVAVGDRRRVDRDRARGGDDEYAGVGASGDGRRTDQHDEPQRLSVARDRQPHAQGRPAQGVIVLEPMGQEDLRALVTSIKWLVLMVGLLVLSTSGLVQSMTALVVERLERER